jgi:hypothetical protein
MIGFLIFLWVGCGALATYLGVRYGKSMEIKTFGQLGECLGVAALGPVGLYHVMTEELKGQKLPWA